MKGSLSISAVVDNAYTSVTKHQKYTEGELVKYLSKCTCSMLSLSLILLIKAEDGCWFSLLLANNPPFEKEIIVALHSFSCCS